MSPFDPQPTVPWHHTRADVLRWLRAVRYDGDALPGYRDTPAERLSPPPIVRIETFTYVLADGSGTITWNISRAKELIVQRSVMEGSQA
jgi:hypothetical protein